MSLDTPLRWFTITLFVLCVWIASYAFLAYPEGDGEEPGLTDESANLAGRVLVPGPSDPATGRAGAKRPTPWRTYDASEVESGATIIADTNVLFHLPLSMQPTTREVLLGNRGKEVRYWGYCFPKDYDPSIRRPTGQFPGPLFLSEAERAARERTYRAKWPVPTIYNPPTREQLKLSAHPRGRIRHEIEVFDPDTSCYLMTEHPLPIGTDGDGDLLNAFLEKQEKTDPSNPDTDGDGIGDGLEVFSLHTNPLLRDSDSDGLIDGIEDRNRNGRTDTGETDAREQDSDGDGLCDGYCRVNRYVRHCGEFAHTKDCIQTSHAQWRGEDKNLNGMIDGNETDPLNVDSDHDGILDEQEYYNCLLLRKSDC